jgi:hypothetical protein
MVLPDPTAKSGRPMASPRLLAGLLVLFIAAGCGTVLLTGQNHHAEAKIACRRFVQRRLAATGVRFSHEKVRDLSSVRHVVTGTAHGAGRPAASYTCTVTHTGSSWTLDGIAGVGK